MLSRSKRSGTNGWRVALKEIFTKNASQIAGNDTFQALQVASYYFFKYDYLYIAYRPIYPRQWHRQEF